MIKKYSSVILFAILFLGSRSSASAQRSFTTMPTKMIIGHVKGMVGTYKSYELLINQISQEFPYSVVLERGASFCFFINKYISGKDSLALKYLNINNKEEKAFYVYLKNQNKEREYYNKIDVKSIDLEHNDNFKTSLNAVYYMLKQVSNTHYQNIADKIYNDSVKVNHIKTKDLIRLIDSTRMSYLMTDDSIYQLIKKNIYKTTDLGAPNSKSWFKGREKLLLENYIFTTVGISRFYFISDISHLPNHKGNKPFLKYAQLKEFGVECYYPIYFNHFSSKEFRKTFYCLHKKNPFRWNSKLAQQFKQKKGSWLMSTKKVNYIIVSN